MFFGILAQAPVASAHAPDLNEHLKSRRNRYCVNIRKSRQGGTVKALWTMLSLKLVLASLPALVDDRQVRIGFVLPLSGDWAFLGNGVRDAARLAESFNGSWIVDAAAASPGFDPSIKKMKNGVSVRR